MMESFFFWAGVVATFFGLMYGLLWICCVCDGREWNSNKKTPKHYR